MALSEVHPVGLEYLDLVTRLLQDARLAEPRGGIWEAADLQWWWRVDQHADPAGQTVWMDRDGPVCATVFTRWKTWVGCDLLGTDAAVETHSAVLWDRVTEEFRRDDVRTMIRDDDVTRIAA